MGSVAFIGLGSNLGNREEHLRQALERLSAVPETKVVRVSRWVETVPVGGPPQGMYLNGAAEIQTGLSPQELLTSLHRVEQALGRFRRQEKVRWGPRVIDLDLLSYDDRVMETPELTLPHPRLHERSFVLIPLAEIAPSWCHPILRRSAQELLSTVASERDSREEVARRGRQEAERARCPAPDSERSEGEGAGRARPDVE